MTASGAKKETWIDCLLAIEDAGIPQQKIPESTILLAFLLAVKRQAEPQEGCPMSELFIEELKKALANPEAPSTQDIITKAQASIEELEQLGTEEALKGARLLQFPLTALKLKLKKDARQEARNN